MKKRSIWIISLVSLIILTAFVYVNNNLKNKKMLNRVEELYAYFSTDDLESCNGLFNYDNKKVEAKDVDLKIKLCLAYNKANTDNSETLSLKKDKKGNVCTKDKMVFRLNDDEKECTYTKINKSILNESYNKIFGSDIDDGANTFQINNMNKCYIKGDYVYCGLSETFTFVIGSDVNIYRSIKSVEEKGDSIILYDYFIKRIENKCYYHYTTESENVICSNRISNVKSINYGFIKSVGTLYKHVFEKDDLGEYHWISSEPIEK